jgi:hypothetical protein
MNAVCSTSQEVNPESLDRAIHASLLHIRHSSPQNLETRNKGPRINFFFCPLSNDGHMFMRQRCRYQRLSARQ